jgi:DNA-binding beta-propeller fold protein YncE
MKLRVSFIIFITLLSCQEKPKPVFDECLYYNLKQPTIIWKMPKELKEISGIEILKNQKVVAHNDEDGNLFVYNLKKKLVEKTVSFANNGDYEDIALKDSTAFVLRSDGIIFEVKNYLKMPQTIKHKTFLTKKDNAEGLFFDASKNRLLIACKGNSEEKKGKNKRFVYELILNKKALNPNPILTISQKEMQKTYHLKSRFSPSGIAIHPISKNIYILSSVGKMLAEYSSEGKLKKTYSLNYSHFQQPEGISFDKNGDLYISNEAKKTKANILKFNYIP